MARLMLAVLPLLTTAALVAGFDRGGIAVLAVLLAATLLAAAGVLYYPVSAILWCWRQVFGSALDPTRGFAWARSCSGRSSRSRSYCTGSPTTPGRWFSNT